MMVEPKSSPQNVQMTPAEREAFESVWRLLRIEWDPTDTDMVPDDDFESFARELSGRLLRGATIEEATAYLGTLETVELGLPERRKRNAGIAATAHAVVRSLREASLGPAMSRMSGRRYGAYQWIRRSLRKDWDPIGLGNEGPDDEYDSYALRLFGRLLHGASIAEGAAFLATVEVSSLGLPERPLSNVEMAAKAHTIVSELKRHEDLEEAVLEWMTPKQREAFAALGKLLRHEWNPIGEDYLPEDEYDDYARTLFSVIHRRESVAEAARYLAVVETAEMGLRERPERNAEIGAKAHAIVMAAKSAPS